MEQVGFSYSTGLKYVFDFPLPLLCLAHGDQMYFLSHVSMDSLALGKSPSFLASDKGWGEVEGRDKF